jgi:hypothetical protein
VLDAQPESALAVGESGGDVEQPVAQCVGFGFGQVAVQEQQLSPGDQVDSHSPASTRDNSPVNVVRSATSASSRDPACDTTPCPSAVTVILRRAVVTCTSKVPLHQIDMSPQQAQFRLVARHFRLSRH